MQFYIFHKNFNKQYYDDFVKYWTRIMYPEMLIGSDLIAKDDD